VVSTLAFLCFPDDETAPADDRLHRDSFGMRRFEWHDEHGAIDCIQFHLGNGDTIRFLRSSGFDIRDLVEIVPSIRHRIRTIRSRARCPERGHGVG
jgi:hypothetical protein